MFLCTDKQFKNKKNVITFEKAPNKLIQEYTKMNIQRYLYKDGRDDMTGTEMVLLLLTTMDEKSFFSLLCSVCDIKSAHILFLTEINTFMQF